MTLKRKNSIFINFAVIDFIKHDVPVLHYFSQKIDIAQIQYGRHPRFDPRWPWNVKQLFVGFVVIDLVENEILQ